MTRSEEEGGRRPRAHAPGRGACQEGQKQERRAVAMNNERRLRGWQAAKCGCRCMQMKECL